MEAYWEAYTSEDFNNYNTMEQKQFDPTNRGALFTNKQKQTDKHPDFNGSINIAGVEHWLSAWKKTSKNGKNYLSISIGDVKEVQPSQQVQEVQQHVQSVQAEQDAISVDEIPW